MANLKLRDIRKSYGALEVVKGVNIDIGDGEFVVLVGPSGCGKSTLLRMIAGLETITAGDLFIDGDRMNDVEPDRRGLAMVFQTYALYPHMTVADNMGFALKLAGAPREVRARKVQDAARILQIDPFLDKKPGQLSGGQRQRVAIGRAIVREPRVFLFDEPLSNLDAALRVQMRVELAKLHRNLAATMIYVTHDQVEAMTMADRIVVLNGGLIEQIGTPMEIYSKPASVFVAGFIGSPKMNLIEAEVADGGELRLPSGAQLKLSGLGRGNVTLGIRPEALSIAESGPLSGQVIVVEHLGGETLTYVDAGSNSVLTVKGGEQAPAGVGERVHLNFDAGRLHVFDENGRSIRSPQ